MFTLGIIEKLTPGEMTGGVFIAGTGEIQPAAISTQPSQVGAIGGILMKMIGARDAGAICVPGARTELSGSGDPDPGRVALGQGGTLDDAMTAVKAIGAGKTPTGC